jgi:hypothetical protein
LTTNPDKRIQYQLRFVLGVAGIQQEIQAAISINLTGMGDGLFGYWNFDDGTAKILFLINRKEEEISTK